MRICGKCHNSDLINNAKFASNSKKLLTALKVDDICIPCKELYKPEATLESRKEEIKRHLAEGKYIKTNSRNLLNS